MVRESTSASDKKGQFLGKIAATVTEKEQIRFAISYRDNTTFADPTDIFFYGPFYSVALYRWSFPHYYDRWKISIEQKEIFINNGSLFDNEYRISIPRKSHS